MKSVISIYSSCIALDALMGQEPEFWNYGYWTPGTENSAQASRQLLEYLTSKLPRTATKILDVAFGKGTSTLRLCEMFGADRVTGVNIAPDQVELAKKRGVPCKLQVMDAGQLEFDPEVFDAILCIEAAFHFKSRLSFLKNAHKALKPGGKLVMSDLFFRTGHGVEPQIFPPENRINSLSEYIDVFAEAGFSPRLVSVEKTTELQLVPFMADLATQANLFNEEIRAGTALEWGRARHVVRSLLNISDSVIVVAEKESSDGS
ncbi:MAG: class I SAM-dependent methyltransferase [Burkholderiaceae bacterium]